MTEVRREVRTGRWARGVQTALSRRNLQDLSAGRIPAIRIDAFVDEASAVAAAGAYGRMARRSYRNVTPPIAKCGPSVYEHPFERRADYFAEARAADGMFAAAMAGAPSLLRLFQDRLLDDCGLASVRAADLCHGDYFAGIFRSMEEGAPIHIDYAPHESPRWEMISDVPAQLSANVYLDGTVGQGALVLHDRFWAPELDDHLLPGRFGYHDEAVRGAAREVIRPALGSMVLFNSRGLHRVDAARRRRLTYSFFLAPQDDRIILWS